MRSGRVKAALDQGGAPRRAVASAPRRQFDPDEAEPRARRADVLTPDQARKKAIAYLGKVAGDEDPQDESDKLRELKTIEELCRAFVENHAKKKRIAWKEVESVLKRRVLPKLPSRLAVSLVSADIEAIHSEIGSRHSYAANRLLESFAKCSTGERLRASHRPDEKR